jgi:eukaryotic-like serine/threonine-protein kinase
MPEETVAGFRIVRKLGSGSRAEVLLGHAGGAEPRTAALKVFRAEVPLDSIDAELRALGAANHAHVVQLRDLAGGADGRPVLVLERLPLGSLAQLLSQRGQLSPGEAVTILAPLAAAVAALQASGVTHGAITAGRVLFRESGAPVLSGFGHAAIGSATDVDRRALAALATTVLERVAQADDLRRWLATLAGYPQSFAEQLSERVFSLAPASPVRFTPDLAVEHVPQRTIRAEPVELAEAPAATWFDPYLARIPERFRKPRWIAAAAAVLTLLVAFVAVPSGSGTASELAPTTAATVPPDGPVYEDDPVAAFSELLRARNECIRDLSILCLDTVLQAGSAALADDTAVIRAIERGEGTQPLIEPSAIAVAERMGDAALLDYLDNDEPASVLLVKTEAGWRIRSYVEAQPVD